MESTNGGSQYINDYTPEPPNYGAIASLIHEMAKSIDRVDPPLTFNVLFFAMTYYYTQCLNAYLATQQNSVITPELVPQVFGEMIWLMLKDNMFDKIAEAYVTLVNVEQLITEALGEK